MNINETLSSDLTRWNRAGLTHIQYVEGNAATYLEDLRLALRQQFAGNPEVLSWLGENLNDKSLRDWQQRLLAQYAGPRRDYAWELLRSLARSTHVLAQTLDAYSNERYLGTATQWDNLRRLVNMLDYRPAPPASAETWVALIAKTPDPAKGITGQASIERGLALQNQPKDGSSPIIFETLEDLALDYRLNQLRAPDYNRSTQNLSIPAQNGSFDFPLTQLPEALSVGDLALVSCLNQALAVRVQQLADDYVRLQVIEQGASARSWALADVRLQLQASWQATPRLNGPNVVEVSAVNAGVRVQDFLAYSSGSSWYLRQVLAVDAERLLFDTSPPLNANLYATLKASKQDDEFVFPKQRGSTSVWRQDGSSATPYAHNEDNKHIYDALAASTSGQMFYLPASPVGLFSLINTSPAALQFAGKAGDLVSGDWIILQAANGAYYSYPVSAINLSETGYNLTTGSNISGGSLANQRWVLALGHFGLSLGARGGDQNLQPIYHHSSSTHSQLTLALADVPAALTIGRGLCLVAPGVAQRVTLTEILASDGTSVTLSVKPSLSGLNLPKYATCVYANLVKAGQGENRGQSVLGSGDRIQANQEFVFAKTGLAFEQDTGFSSGVRAAITLTVGDRTWTQVDNLRDSEATDTHYQTSLNEDEQLVIRFGDGVHGQRLPTGSNNLLISARFGAGVQGNLAAYSLSKLKKPHLQIDSLLQPLPASGGGDRESSESLRELAPASVLTLERAVSIADYGHLAQQLASVWQARAYALPDTPRATDRVEVVLVPAGGGAPSSEFSASIKQYLEGLSRPGVLVSIQGYQAILLDLRLHLRVDIQAYDGDKVCEQVRLALLDAFALQQSRLAQPLYLSRVYQVVEAVEGVENVDVQINPDGFVDESLSPIAPADVFYGTDASIKRISPGERQLVYLNAALIAPNISWEASYE